MSLWDETVRPMLLSNSLPERSILAISGRCIKHVLDTCSAKWEAEVPSGQVQVLSNALSDLIEEISQDHGAAIQNSESQHPRIIEELEQILPDEDSHLTFASGWSCVVQSIIEFAGMLDTQGDLTSKASDVIDLAYQAATRDAVQEAIRSGGIAIGEEELKAIERATPACLNEINYQTGLLNAAAPPAA